MPWGEGHQGATFDILSWNSSFVILYCLVAKQKFPQTQGHHVLMSFTSSHNPSLVFPSPRTGQLSQGAWTPSDCPVRKVFPVNGHDSTLLGSSVLSLPLFSWCLLKRTLVVGAAPRKGQLAQKRTCAQPNLENTENGLKLLHLSQNAPCPFYKRGEEDRGEEKNNTSQGDIETPISVWGSMPCNSDVFNGPIFLYWIPVPGDLNLLSQQFPAPFSHGVLRLKYYAVENEPATSTSWDLMQE